MRKLILTFGLCASALLGACTRVVTVQPSPSASESTVVEGPSIPPETTTPFIPDPNTFELTVKILGKQCFGSAGCNITYRIGVSYVGPPLDPSVTYEVTYRVVGDDSGPQINTLTVTGDQSSVDKEDTASTSSSGTKLTAKATSVDVLS